MSPPSNVRILTLFVSSPSDVRDARDKVDEVVTRLNRLVARRNGFQLVTFRWERDVVPEYGNSPQDIIDGQLGHYDIFVGIMWKRFGTPTGMAGSGTEHELRAAVSQFGKPNAPRIMFYRCLKPFYPDDEDCSQISSVRRFLADVESNAIVTPYVTLDEFGSSLEEHLTTIVLDLARKTDSVRPRAIDASIESLRPEAARAEICKKAPTDALKILHELNPLDKVPGRALSLGLTPNEAEYICSYLIEHGFLRNPSRQDQRQFIDSLLETTPSAAPTRVGAFLLSRYPVTNEQFELFVSQRGNYQTTAEKRKSETTWRTAFRESGPNHPATHVSFRDAQEFCSWAGVRLPTRKEYERAVRGLNDTLFPWGARWERDCCNDILYLGDEKTSPVDAFRDFASSDGVCDLCGNVFEWVTGNAGQRGVELVVGGAFNACSVVLGNAACSLKAQVDVFAWNVGFRFASDTSRSERTGS